MGPGFDREALARGVAVRSDIICIFERLVAPLKIEGVARFYQVPAAKLKRFDISDLRVIKFSMARPIIQGSAADRDMHGAQYAALLEEMAV